MPNHWHFLAQPEGNNDLSRFVHWLATTHSRRWNIAHNKCGEGAVYQSRFKAIPVQQGIHLLQVWRYIERNPLRAHLVGRAEEWRWSSLTGPREQNGLLSAGPINLPSDWVDLVNLPQSESEVAAIRDATEREREFGERPWTAEMRERAGYAARHRGRPLSVLSDLRKT
jgi:putative transposase